MLRLGGFVADFACGAVGFGGRGGCYVNSNGIEVEKIMGGVERVLGRGVVRGSLTLG